jgi:hypothetical protein
MREIANARRRTIFELSPPTEIATKFPGDERHVRRIQKVGNYEVTGDL